MQDTPEKLISPGWMYDPAVRVVFNVFAKAAAPVRAVGGCVRDAIMNRSCNDIDFATPLIPTKVAELFEAAGYRVEPTGIEHGTVSVIIDHVAYEITTLRRDVATDGRRAVVAFTEDWTEDAQRRDFRCNALYMDSDGRVYDPTGGGVQDAIDRHLVFVGNAGERIQEDYLRILRMFRFMATLGATCDQNAIYACCYHRRGIQDISGERIEKEMMKLLGSDEPLPSIQKMVASEVLAIVIPHNDAEARMKSLSRLFYHGPEDAALRLAALLGHLRYGDVLDHWNSSNELKSRVGNALVQSVFPDGETDDQIRVRMHKHGHQAVADGLWLNWANAVDTDVRAAEIMRREYLSAPPFPIKGQDILNAGMKPGKNVGAVLKDVENYWLDNGFVSEDECRAFMKATIAAYEEKTNAA